MNAPRRPASPLSVSKEVYALPAPLPGCSPTDYLFQPDRFRDDPAQFGPPLDFREPSFLDNPRTPAAVKVCGAGRGRLGRGGAGRGGAGRRRDGGSCQCALGAAGRGWAGWGGVGEVGGFSCWPEWAPLVPARLQGKPFAQRQCRSPPESEVIPLRSSP